MVWELVKTVFFYSATNSSARSKTRYLARFSN